MEKTENVSLLCNFAWKMIFTISHHTPGEKNHSPFYKKTDSEEQLSSHTSAKQTQMCLFMINEQN